MVTSSSAGQRVLLWKIYLSFFFYGQVSCECE